MARLKLLRINFQEKQLNISKYLNIFSLKYLDLNQTEPYTSYMYFDTTYKKAARRVNLLKSIRPSVDQKWAKTIYITMILQTFTCCFTWSWLVRYPKKSHKEH